MARQAHAQGAEALPVEVLAHPAHFLGCAGETMDQHAAGSAATAGKKEGFGGWNGLRHGTRNSVI